VKREHRTFVSEATIELLDSKIHVEFIRKRYVDKDYSGLFDHINKTLRVATWHKPEFWVPIFLHEYCHFKQWKEQTEHWVNAENSPFMDWLYDSSIKDIDYNKECHLCQLMEQECDRKVIRLMLHYKMIGHMRDVQRCIKAMNLYHISYQVMKEERSWLRKASACCIEELYDMVPGSFLDAEELKHPDPKLKLKIKEHCF
jgi:hypothetical protein